jgi:hypothetical protein
MAKQYQVQNYINGKPELFDSEKEANVRIKEIEAELMAKHERSFSVILTVPTAQGVMWISPSENSEEDATYMVFVPKFGQYENVKGRTAAYARRQELIDEFLADFVQTPQLYVAPVQPKTTGTQEL